MYNDIIEILKLTLLSQYDVDYCKTTVQVDISTNEINIHLFLNLSSKDCPYCKSMNSTRHANLIKQIYHPVLENKNTTIYFHQVKLKCKECGHYFNQFNPLVSGSKNISLAGEWNILTSLKSQRKTFKDIALNYYLPYTSVVRSFDEHVSITPHHLTKVLCFDEIYSKKLTETKYAFVMFDPISSTVLDILDARLKNVLVDYFSRIPLKERKMVDFVNIDMWDTYRIVAEKAFPNATICVDSFHVIKHLNKAMDDIRKNLQKRFIDRKDDDRNGYYWLLKTFHYYLVQDFDKIKYVRRPKSHYSYLWDKHAVLAKLLSIDEHLKEAYYLKEDYREFNLCGTYEEALVKLDDFVERFKRSYYNEMREFGYLLARWRYEIINSFIRVKGKRMSNGPMESLNGRLKRLLEDGYGYTNFERFRNRLMFSLNKDEPLKF